MKSVRRPVVAQSVMLVLVVIQAVVDPTGLLALVGWSGATPSLAAGPWSFAPYVVFVPALLAALWWVAVRAGDRFWTLAAGTVLAVLLAQAATALVMTGDPAIAGRAASFVAAKALPAALIVAAFTRWFGVPTERLSPAPGSSWPPAVLFAALAPLLAGLWWTGAAYAPGIPSPRPENGIVPVSIAMVLIAAATALSLRWTRPRVPGVLGGWLAALVAGGIFGLVQAAVGFFVDRGPGGDIWPLMVAYLAVADGLAFGACLGWIVGLAAAPADRLRTGRAGQGARVPELIAASAAIISLGATLLVPGFTPAVAAPEKVSPPAGFLRAEGSRITDGKGNQVLLRGVNVNQLVDFYQPRSEVPATRPLTEGDYAGIAAQGFNVVRLNISWSALEPERGSLDPAYLEQITDAVDWVKIHGIYTVLDTHQDGWWNGPSAEGTTCRPGTEPMWGYDGAPEWATITDGAPRCQFTGRDISPTGNRSFQNFYFNTDGVQTALAKTWASLPPASATSPWSPATT
ncbi:cellulase family glycosylhydrolase [Paeniglutamicibacter sp. NPDC091659]|uniref:cellulase family glycosylhydrolase n=1 Tax=Paeniglutamicibacter sp. NPDC091659 TaxID=3364389 RepID=UPI00380ABF0E